MALLPVEDALARILAGVSPLPAETVGLLEARDRVLAETIAARRTQPPFESSAMDGYAVRARDLAQMPATLTVVGESQAGRRHADAIGPGEAVRIFTGAALPESADTVVIQEDTERTGDKVLVREAPKPGANVRVAGGDFRQGEVLLQTGRRIDAAAVLLAAAAGHAELSVRRCPRIAIVATGDELVEPGTIPGPDQIVSSNPYGLAALVARFGGVPQILGIAADAREAIGAKIAAARGADVLVTIGGASVGDRDLVRPVLEEAGMTLDFWKVAIRPGKPMLFGRMQEMRVLGLPGNPVSCLVAARVFLVPLLFALLGRTSDALPSMTAVLANDLPANGPRQHYMLAKLEESAEGPPRVSALASQDSARISGLAAADVLIVRAPEAPAARAGDSVRVLPLDL
jgi:molybdopterin molybdotransferase